MQKETKETFLIAVGSFFGGVIVTLLVLWLTMAMTRPCHKPMGPMPTHEQSVTHRADSEKIANRGPRARRLGEKPARERRKQPKEPTEG